MGNIIAAFFFFYFILSFNNPKGMKPSPLVNHVNLTSVVYFNLEV